ncbi:MAG: 23S rRNA (uracil(1939)-C(5))-methyltransferase RlmD [Bacteroidetes bacterium]|nr:MAG: 23S rRNA (uracil(1939)-C(5))-methyltransferase RlmD [Bacteroidota bacterium]
MTRKKKELPVLEHITIIDAGAEGNAVARVGDRVVFVPFAVPGDVVDIQVIRMRRNYYEGKVVQVHTRSERRTEPVCSHFGTCGGCRWQNMRYEDQLFFKQKQVEDNLNRIGKFYGFDLLPILPSATTTHYRNKLEYTFSNRRWLTREEIGIRNEDGGMRNEEKGTGNALGFHIPGMFDKVLDIHTCHLQQEPSNSIRLAIKEYAREKGFTFYDMRNWTGFLRNVIIRTSSTGEVMVIVVVREEIQEEVHALLDHLARLFPAITSLYFVVNQKRNDSLLDQKFNLYKGEPFITERMQAFQEEDPDLIFRIGPNSFFQTNSGQAEKLYRTVTGFAGLRGDEVVYDLYTGIGTIAIYLSRYVKQVIGVESVGPAVSDADQNAVLNGIQNARFITGEVESVLDPAFIDAHGKPDLIIADPPRSGMQEKGIRAILSAAPQTLVYISCNPATQARDLALLKEHYQLIKCQPVDMFPHTQHVENVALLKRRTRDEGRISYFLISQFHPLQ